MLSTRVLSCSCFTHHAALHSFPTRRSSDLLPLPRLPRGLRPRRVRALSASISEISMPSRRPLSATLTWSVCHSRRMASKMAQPRSEEHTSELQSREKLVCRLLLEKKKQNMNKIRIQRKEILPKYKQRP